MFAGLFSDYALSTHLNGVGACLFIPVLHSLNGEIPSLFYCRLRISQIVLECFPRLLQNLLKFLPCIRSFLCDCCFSCLVKLLGFACLICKRLPSSLDGFKSNPSGPLDAL